jgi:MoxR-like ATPase
MKTSKLPRALLTAHLADLSVFVKGAPGTSKTAQIRQYAKALGMELLAIHVPLSDLLDIKGVIHTDNETARFLPFSAWPKESDRPVIVLLDELPQQVPAIVNAYSQLLIDKQMGDIKLPRGSMVIATGNRKEDRAATHNIPSHVVNRVVHIDLEHSAEDFINWGMNGQPSPFNVSESIRKELEAEKAQQPIRSEVLAFVQFRPSLVHTFDPKDTQSPFSSYRSLEQASKLLNALDTLGSSDLKYDMLRGVLGEGVASEFMSYIKMYRELPDPQYILDNISTFKIPTEPSVLYAVCVGVATIVSDENVDKFYKFINKLKEVEFAIKCLKNAKAKWSGVVYSSDGMPRPEFIAFSDKHKDVLF